MESEHFARKLAAILSADVVGYSRLMSEDEEATVRMLNRLRERVAPVVSRHHGRVVDFRGDDFLSEFPSALDAVRCAVEVQADLRRENADLPEARRMLLRIGIHLGDVMVQGDRIYGDGVNISSRLEGLADPGGLCISGPVHEQVRHKIGLGFEDEGEQEVKNLPDPVRVWRAGLGNAAAPTPVARSRRVLVAALVSVVVIAFGALLVWPLVPGLVLDAFALNRPLVDPPLPQRPSIVVLPFTNLSGDPEQEYFSDGLTEDLTTDLSRVSNLFVISRSSAFTYRGRAVRVEDIGRELGVHYLLEGSVRKSQGRIRINAQLIDTATGYHVWADRYDREYEDLFEVQAEISDRILGALQVRIVESEVASLRRVPTADLTAYELYLRAIDAAGNFDRPDGVIRSRELLERARRSSRGELLSRAGLAGYYEEMGRHDEAARLVGELLDINPDLTTRHIQAHFMSSAASGERGRHLRAAGLL